MKPKLIIGIVAIVGFTSLLMYNFGESISTYTTFEGAADMSSAHIPGTWVEEKGAEFSLETKKFVFYMTDEDGVSKKVVYSKPKPNNFEEADQLVVIGKMRGEIFYADEMLMKCPSKYNSTDPSQFSEASIQ